MSLILHQFPISHYCEKVRWALDYKRVDYHLENYLPGLHLKSIRAMADRSSVPVLAHDGRIIQGSAAIISYLDDQFPERSLTPEGEALATQAKEWEQFCDRDIGVHVRRFCYDTLLRHPKIVVPLLAHGGPFWAKAMLRMTFPKLDKSMRKLLLVREPEVSESRRALERSLGRLQGALKDRQYLVGNAFSRADLAAAALLAPLFMPPEYGVHWPHQVPEPLAGWIADHQEILGWASGIYRLHR